MVTTKEPTSRREPSIHDANSAMFSGLTHLVMSGIQSLPLQGGFKVQYLQEECFSKYVSTDTDPANVRRQRAINKWLATERDNAATNDRLLFMPDGYHILPRVKWSAFKAYCSNLIVDIIGETVPVDALIGSFSGGASTSRLRTESHPASKYTGRADCTAAAWPWFEQALDHMPGWAFSLFYEKRSLDLHLVEGNVLFTVPKKTDIDRVAAKEPDINMFLQKGVGNYIRKNLRRFGINLNDQSRNRELARMGSIHGELATVDLSSASDSVSLELVRSFLPIHWSLLLEDLRSPVTEIDGEKHVNEMFSSMGNGFTFELESMLFYVIARAVAYFEGVSGTISVYGDDIIIPSVIYPSLEWVFGILGFSVNPDKSFWTGHFRESCGGHYLHGYDVTPFYVRRPIERLTDVIRTCNQMRAWAQSPLGVNDQTIEPLWRYLSSLVPQRFWGGRDLSSITQLATNEAPSKRLVSIKSKPESTGLGGFIHWLNATDGRRTLGGDGVATSSKSTVTTRYRERRVNSTVDLPRLDPWLGDLEQPVVTG